MEVPHSPPSIRPARAGDKTDDQTPNPGGPDLPPVKTLLAALVWLAARQRTQPEIGNLHAIVHQIQRLAVHPQADIQDLRAGLRLAAGVEIDVARWMGCCLAGELARLH